MKLEDGLKLEANRWGRVEIPECSRDDLPQFFVDRGYKVGAEIGTYKGEFCEKFCKAGLKMYAIDPWSIFKDYHYDQSQKRQDTLSNIAKKRLAPYDCTIIRKTSMNAMEDFEDESLDFVYIDGNHSFRYVAEDICGWTEKVRKGGVISGHDYARFGLRWNIDVREVVDAYVLPRHINPWYILGRTRRKRPEEVRDRFRSWAWFKK